MKKQNKRIVSIIAIIAILLTMAFGAFSYFTDYATTTIDSVAGTLDIELVESIDLDGKLGILNPGDKSDFSFSVKNLGQKSVDLMAEIIVYAKDENGNTLDMTKGTYTAYNSDTATTYTFNDHVYKIVDDNGNELAYSNDETDTNKVIYTIGDSNDTNGTMVTLDGTVENDAAIEGVVDTYSTTFGYTFVMDSIAKNDWQGTDVYVTVNVYAKQHRNTTKDTWELIKTFQAVNEAVVGADGEWEYIVLASGKIQLTRYLGTNTEVTVPATYDGYTVYSVGNVDAFFTPDGKQLYNVFGAENSISNTTVTSITIEDGIQVIETAAFRGCTGLTCDLEIPSSVTKIGDHAFRGCQNLKSLTLNEGLTTIGDQAFEMGERKSTAFANATLTLPSTLTTIGFKSFNYCDFKGDLDIPEGVVSIDRAAFQYCTFDGELSLPSTLVSIGDYAFNHCEYFSNESLTIPASVEIIGTEEISTHAFYSFATKTLVEYKVEDGSEHFAAVDGVLYTKDLTRLVAYPPNKVGSHYEILEGVTVIDGYSFSRAGNTRFATEVNGLKSVTIPDSYEITRTDSAGSLAAALYVYTGVEAVHVKDSNEKYTSIDGVIYKNDENGNPAILWYVPVYKTGTVEIPDTVTKIEVDAVYSTETDGANREYSIIIPASVTDIDSSTEKDLNKLCKKNKVTFEEGCVYQWNGSKIVKITE